VGSAEDIDRGMKLGTNQPMGPLQLADFIGMMKQLCDPASLDATKPFWLTADESDTTAAEGFLRPIETCAEQEDCVPPEELHDHLNT
jgi:3-hydroxyacyl-CoA dehydrogenase